MIRKVWLMGVLSLALPLVTSHIAAVNKDLEVPRSTALRALGLPDPLTTNQIEAVRNVLPHTKLSSPWYKLLQGIHNTDARKNINSDKNIICKEYIEGLNSLHKDIKTHYQSYSAHEAVQTVITHIHEVQQRCKKQENNTSELSNVLRSAFLTAPRIVPLKFSAPDTGHLFAESLQPLNDATLYQVQNAFNQIGSKNHTKHNNVVAAFEKEDFKMETLKIAIVNLDDSHKNKLIQELQTILNQGQPQTTPAKKEETQPQRPRSSHPLHQRRWQRGNPRNRNLLKQRGNPRNRAKGSWFTRLFRSIFGSRKKANQDKLSIKQKKLLRMNLSRQQKQIQSLKPQTKVVPSGTSPNADQQKAKSTLI